MLVETGLICKVVLPNLRVLSFSLSVAVAADGTGWSEKNADLWNRKRNVLVAIQRYINLKCWENVVCISICYVLSLLYRDIVIRYFQKQFV